MEAATKFYMNIYSCFEKVKDAVFLRSTRRSLLEIIEGWEELSRKIIDFIRDAQRTRYILVTIAEALGVRLTERMVKELEENGLSAGNLIINHVVRDEDCPFHKIRRGMQERYIKELGALCSGLNMVTLYLSPDEIKGLEKINDISHALFSDGV
jgi:anion-transporting  ArsA/GET3 family ATPase